ncbi:charged multivesicular body protein 4b-like [Antedon mediterranea]|uniref:charged multivesicular body protein 4b-like n=1 Tax=Antedon mediterranea TaxID=105859 RepID=UPI003AF6363F
MSFTKFFGGKKKEALPSTGDAIQKLRQTEEMLTKKQVFLEKKINQELKIAKEKGTKDKRAALNALKRKKRLEKQLQQIDGTLSTIEFQREALENANTNSEVLNTMTYAAKALKSAHKSLDVDQVHDMMDDISEQMELSNEIGEAISSPSQYDDVDEDDLLAELEELEQEELDEKLLDVGPSVTDRLPDVPSEVPQPQKSKKVVEDEDDMAELAAWAS